MTSLLRCRRGNPQLTTIPTQPSTMTVEPSDTGRRKLGPRFRASMTCRLPLELSGSATISVGPLSMTPLCEVEQVCTVKYSHLDIMFRFSVGSASYHMTFNPCSAWAQQLPDVWGHNWFILAVMRNMDWTNHDE
eukprot:2861822-Pyramimonas_sp.AAC.1